MDELDLIWQTPQESVESGCVADSTTSYGSSPPTPVYLDADRGIRLYRGDSLEMLRRARSGSFDLIFADPPYFLSNNGMTCHAGKRVSVNKGMWDKAETFEFVHEFNIEWLKECRRLLKPNGTIWITGTNHNIYSVGYALQTLGYKILNDIAWYKINPPPNLSCRYFTHATETVLWARRDPSGRHTFHYEEMKVIGDPNPGKQMQSLWRIPPPGSREKRYGKHPTQKPEALLDRIVRASTNPGDVVLDPFCGSGTTGVAAVRLGRRFVGMDVSEEYLNVARQRIEDETKPQQLTLEPAPVSGGGGVDGTL
jgi:site-specific DNA-methyltransferase (adenine-specific)